MKNLDELMKNRKLLEQTGRTELLEIIGVLLDERQVFMTNLNGGGPGPRSRRDRDAEVYFNEAEHQLAKDYQVLHDSFEDSEEIQKSETD